MGLINFDDWVALLLDLCVYSMVLFYIIMDIKKLLTMGRYAETLNLGVWGLGV
jgi:hypothetical protein